MLLTAIIYAISEVVASGVISTAGKIVIKMQEFFNVSQVTSSSFSAISQSYLTSKREHKQIIRIICKNIHEYNGNPSKTGLISRNVASSHFLDLFSACTALNTRNTLSRLLYKKMKEVEFVRKTKFDFLAVPKEGNVLLVDALSQRSKKPLLVVRRRAIRFDYPIEGSLQTNKNVLLVDDIGSDGNFLKNAILALREHGAVVKVVICIVDRTDGNVQKILTDDDVSYNYIYSIDDKILRKAISV